MAKYIQYLRGRTVDHLLTYGLGDWYDIGPGAPGESKLTTKGLTATAIYYQALTAMERIALLTGHSSDAPAYRTEAERVKAAFNARFLDVHLHQYDHGSQTADAMPLVVGLVPEEQRAAVLEHLIADIHHHTDHVTAGDIGFHYVVRALTDSGRSDVLYAMLNRTDSPSYGYQLAHGATTLTEAWDANPESSQNHFMLGHAEEWFYRGLAGIDFDFSRATNDRIRIHPAIVEGVHDAAATFQSKLGVIESSWSHTATGLTMSVGIPAGASATIIFPATYSSAITYHGRPLQAGEGLQSVHISGRTASCVAGEGKYVFVLQR
jgi:hypothetical protein